MSELNLAQIPDRVKERSEVEGIPLEEAYAEYLACREREKEIARSADELAMERTPGCPRGAGCGRLYSVEEMKSMSPKDVKKRYASLMDSLKRGIEKIF